MALGLGVLLFVSSPDLASEPELELGSEPESLLGLGAGVDPGPILTGVAAPKVVASAIAATWQA